jgi:hypothetical protein
MVNAPWADGVRMKTREMCIFGVLRIWRNLQVLQSLWNDLLFFDSNHCLSARPHLVYTKKTMLTSEMSRIAELKEGGCALVQLAESQFPGLRFEATPQGRYVSRPANYITFKVHSERARNITLTLRGNPGEFPRTDELLVRPDRPGYSSVRVTNAGQLPAAEMCIRRAAEIYRVRSRRAW